MTKLLSLAPDEIDVLIDWWAERIGHGDEHGADIACARIQQLEAAKTPDPGSDEFQPAEVLAP